MQKAKKTTLHTLREYKTKGEKIAMLTCYDYPTAQIMSEAGIDVILVGDTYAEVCLGHSSTLPATMDTMVEISAAVRRGAPKAFVIGDMPYLSYQADPSEAIHNAGRLMAQAGCDAVKIEVDRGLLTTVQAMCRATIPVVAHLGLKPQSIHRLGGYRCQAKTAESAQGLIDDAAAMEQAGACMLLLEAVPTEVAQIITERTELPVIGIAAGPFCDGQVLVLHDILGYQLGHPPRAVKRYAQLHDVLLQAFKDYRQDVRQGAFPAGEHGIRMGEGEFEKLKQS